MTREEYEQRIAALPRVRLQWGRDWATFRGYLICLMWNKRPSPLDGELAYQSWISLRWAPPRVDWGWLSLRRN